MYLRHTLTVLSVCLIVFAVSTPLDAQASNPLSLQLPFQKTDYKKVKLTTQPGGISSVPGRVPQVKLLPKQEQMAENSGYYRDPFHAEYYRDYRHGRGGKIRKGAYWAMDLAAPVGTEIVAADSGTLTAINRYLTYPYLIVDTGGGYSIKYEELDIDPDLGVRQPVKEGQTLGKIGKSGHLHFEPQYNDNAHKDNKHVADLEIAGVPISSFQLTGANASKSETTPVTKIVSTLIANNRTLTDTEVQALYNASGNSSAVNHSEASGQSSYTATLIRSGTSSDKGVYGTLGRPAPSNMPAARVEAATWTDANGRLWLFGGNAEYEVQGGPGNPSATATMNISLSDLWRYDPSTDLWTWMGGPDYASYISQ
jgi:hypothetical protein